MREHVGAGRRLAAAAQVGTLLEDRLLAEVEPDHVRHVRIDRLVVGDAGADRVGERDAAGAVGREQARHAEHRIGAERERVEEVVVDAPVDHVDALRAARRAHVDDVVLDEQVAGPRPARRPSAARGTRARSRRELYVPGVSTTTVGSLRAGRRHRAQVLEQQVRIVLRPARRAAWRTARGRAASSSCGSRACTTRRDGTRRLSSST